MVRRLIEDYDFAPDAAASEALVAFAQNLRAFDALIDFLEAQAPFGRDALVVAASGNESRHTDSQPAAISAGLPSSAEGVEAMDELNGALEELEASEEQQVERLEQLRQQLQQATQAQQQAQGDLQRLNGRLASLEALQQAALDPGTGTAEWLRDQHLRPPMPRIETDFAELAPTPLGTTATGKQAS